MGLPDSFLRSIFPCVIYSWDGQIFFRSSLVKSETIKEGKCNYPLCGREYLLVWPDLTNHVDSVMDPVGQRPWSIGRICRKWFTFCLLVAFFTAHQFVLSFFLLYESAVQLIFVKAPEFLCNRKKLAISVWATYGISRCDSPFVSWPIFHCWLHYSICSLKPMTKFF